MALPVRAGRKLPLVKVILVAVVALLAVVDLVARTIAEEANRHHGFTGSVSLAFAGDLTGPDKTAGNEMLRAVQDAVDSLNAAGGLGGLKVEVLPFDDGNDPERARAVAEEIVHDPAILAVIGHDYSNASLAAAPVYKAGEIPAITPSSTNPGVTADNPWYFRGIYDDNMQGEFLAHYAGMVLGTSRIAIVAETDLYADGISSAVKRGAAYRKMAVVAEWHGEPDGPDGAEHLSQLTDTLAALPPDTIVIVAAHHGAGVRIVRSMRDGGNKMRILVPDSLGTVEFARAFADLPSNRTTPGFYTDNVFAAVPFLADIANPEARGLFERMAASGYPMSSWHTPYAYDAAKVMIEAMRRAGVGPAVPGDARHAIRDQLALMRSLASGVQGASGVTWFDGNRTADKPVTMAQFSDTLMSYLQQLRPLGSGKELSILPVVYTGIVLHRVEWASPNSRELDVDFDIWFRYQGNVPVEDIAFEGAVTPVRLDKVVESNTANGIKYRLYSAHGRFRPDTGGGRAARGWIGLPIVFHHRSLSRDQLIYIPDSRTMPTLAGPELAAQVGQSAMLPSGYALADGSFSVDTLLRSTLGNPGLSAGAPTVEMPGLALTIDLGPDVGGIRRQWLGREVEIAAIALSVALVALLLLDGRRPLARWPRASLLTLMLVMGGFLVTAEGSVVRLLVDLHGERWVATSTMVFDVAWWLISAFLVNMGIRRLLWTPLETATGHPVPKVIKTVLTGIIIILTVFGIVSGVFHHDITGLVATSGVLAMVIGLALQTNLSNIFSGIALNVERPIRPGDWVIIGGGPAARVLDISWRATKVRTQNNTVLSLPNSMVTGVSIENFSYPETFFILEQAVNFDGKLDPVLLTELLADALAMVKPPDGRPRLTVQEVVFNGATSSTASFVVRHDCTDMHLHAMQKHRVLLAINTVMREAGIAVTSGPSDIVRPKPATRSEASLPEIAAQLGRCCPPLASLPPADRERLAMSIKRHLLGDGETLFAAGEPARSLFLMVSGVIGFTRPDGTVPDPAQVEAGVLFGEESLSEGGVQACTAQAIDGAEVYEIAPDALAPIMAQNPRLNESLTELLASHAPAGLSLAGGTAGKSDLLGHLRGLWGKHGKA